MAGQGVQLIDAAGTKCPSPSAATTISMRKRRCEQPLASDSIRNAVLTDTSPVAAKPQTLVWSNPWHNLAFGFGSG